MMRFWDCCGLWCDKLWMLVRVLTGGSPPPETEICRGARQDSRHQRHSQGGCSRPPPLPGGRLEGGISKAPSQEASGLQPRWGTFSSAPTAPAAPGLQTLAGMPEHRVNK